MYLSLVERPVRLPVSTARAPLEARKPSLRHNDCSTSRAAGRFLWVFGRSIRLLRELDISAVSSRETIQYFTLQHGHCQSEETREAEYATPALHKIMESASIPTPLCAELGDPFGRSIVLFEHSDELLHCLLNVQRIHLAPAVITILDGCLQEASGSFHRQSVGDDVAGRALVIAPSL